jgi:hypothetical protein
VTLHDAGRVLNPALLDGQVHGGFAMAVGAAFYERLVYPEDGGCVTGSFLDYALPTCSMISELEILHQKTPPARRQGGSRGELDEHAGVHRLRCRRRARCGGGQPTADTGTCAADGEVPRLIAVQRRSAGFGTETAEFPPCAVAGAALHQHA